MLCQLSICSLVWGIALSRKAQEYILQGQGNLDLYAVITTIVADSINQVYSQSINFSADTDAIKLLSNSVGALATLCSLSIYVVQFIEGWDKQFIRKICHLVQWSKKILNRNPISPITPASLSVVPNEYNLLLSLNQYSNDKLLKKFGYYGILPDFGTQVCKEDNNMYVRNVYYQVDIF